MGEGADVLEAMARDKDCFVVMTLAGAMTVAKQGLIVTELIDRAREGHHLNRRADGAWFGRGHGAPLQVRPKMDDVELYEAGYNRVYDTLEPETNLDYVETIVAKILDGWDHAKSSARTRSIVRSGAF